MQIMKSFFGFCFFLCLQGLSAQENPTPNSELVNSIFEEMNQQSQTDSLIKEQIDIIPAPELEGMDDSLLRAKYLESLQEYYTYRINGYKHRRHVFEWQLTSSKIVFFFVLLLLVAGIYFSGVQFRKWMKHNETHVTEFEASTDGIKVSSPVLGVIILLISLMFFYLYLIYIYPIQEIF